MPDEHAEQVEVLSGWTKRDAYTMQCGPWQVCKTLTDGFPRYTLTHDAITRAWCGVRTHKIIGVFASFDGAKEEVERLTTGGKDDD